MLWNQYETVKYGLSWKVRFNVRAFPLNIKFEIVYSFLVGRLVGWIISSYQESKKSESPIDFSFGYEPNEI